MLRVSIELIPFGDESKSEKIEVLNIGNMTPFQSLATYHGWFDVDPRQFPRPEPQVVVTHLRSKGAWELVRKCLEARTLPKDEAENPGECGAV